MGLRIESIYLLMKEGLRQNFSGKVITLGKQDVWCTYGEVCDLAKKMSYPLRNDVEVELSEKTEMKAKEYISDSTLFNLLGFSEICSLDASSYENADVLYDLNVDSLPQELQGRFDVVLDPGTIEHVFHVPNSLKNIFNMLKIDGRIIHISPSSNHFDHGFYMFSPTLFWDYYEVNCFDIHSMNIIQYKPQWVYPWKIAAYTSGDFNSFSFGGLDNSMYAVCCIATKNHASTHDKIPQQFNFAKKLWMNEQLIQKAPKIIDFFKKFRILYKLALFFKRLKLNLSLKLKFKNIDV